MNYVPTTKSGHLLGEVISALQKEIRRGNEYEAFWWAVELCPEYEAYCWQRLLVIAHEDIGIANVPLLGALPHWRDLYFELRGAGAKGEGKPDAILMLSNAVLAMARSPKCRLSDTFQAAVLADRKQAYEAYLAAKKSGAPLPPKKPIPDYALDKHTARGKQQGRGVDHWMDEGCVLVPAPVVDPVYGELDDVRYRERARVAWRDEGLSGPHWPKRKSQNDKKSTPVATVPEVDLLEI